jgi:hypothetical protein
MKKPEGSLSISQESTIWLSIALCNITLNAGLFCDDKLFVHAHPGAGRPLLAGCPQLQYAAYSEVKCKVK